MRTPRCVRVSRVMNRQRGAQQSSEESCSPRPTTLAGSQAESAEILRWLILACIVWCAAVSSAFAQLPQTRIYAAFPPGGQAGATLDYAITRGDDLDDLGRLIFSHPGIVATAKTNMAPNGKPELVANQFSVNVSASVPPGNYEVRGVGLFGISNPRTFVVGTRPEILEVEPNNAREQATVVEPGQTINGRINGATDVDFFKFTGTPGQRVILDCAAQRIDSKLDGSLEIHDATGRRLATARNNTGRDAVLDFTVTQPGEYFLRLTDFVYAGSEDHFYRLSLRTSPYIDFVVPPAGVPGSTAQHTVYGRNLPAGEATDLKLDGQPLQKQTVSITLPAEATAWPAGLRLEPYASGVDGFPFTLDAPNGPSNPVMIGFSAAAVTAEVEPNNLPANVQKVTVPAELAGQFQAKGDVDLYQFDAKAGEIVWLEVQGQRLGSGCDPYLTLDQVTVNDKGEETLKRIAAVDDEGTNLLPIVFDTIHDDPVYKFTAPADGQFRVTLRDRFGASRGALSLQYRLTLRRELPDYRVVVVTEIPQPPNVKNPQTWSIGLRRGDQFSVWAVVLRRDGFEDDVEISVEGLPAGVTCRGTTVGSKPSQGLLVFESAEDAAEWAGTVKVIGKAKIADPVVAATVVTATAAIKPAQDAVTATTTALAKPAAELKAAKEALTAAKAELAAKPDDEALKKKVADAEAKVAAVKTVNDTAIAAKANADKQLADARAAVDAAKAAKAAATKEVVREARYGTIAWSGGANIPGKPRLSQGLELSVVAENAPFQVKTDVHRVTANHSRQVLVPVKAIRREGFDADIPLTFIGQPQNVQIENKPIKKGTGEEVYRIFVPPNAPVGTYVMYLASQAQVSYRRNPQKADRLKVEFDAAEKAANEAVELQKAGVAKRDEATKLAAASAETLKQATEAKAAADKALTAAQAAEKAAAEAVTKAGEDATAKAEAEKKLVEAQAATKVANDAVTAAEQARVDADAKSKAAAEAKTAAENEAKQADEKVKATMAEKAAADKRFKDADTAAKAKNVNFMPTTTPIVLTIKPAPCTLTATPADGGKLKQGTKVEVKVGIKRQNDFAGPVTLTLDVPPNIKGIAAAPVTVAPDQAEGTLAIEATAEAPEGAIANLVVRAAAEFDGAALVDQPVAITVSK